MGRFSEPQDPLFRALNSSISFDFRLAPYDIEQSLAHARMLAHSNIIHANDLAAIEAGLAQVRDEVEGDDFQLHEDDEDVHMAIERRLTEIAGDAGARLHTARSRNDQVATDVAMLVRAHSL
ncbi:MAG: lyase family protein, partial [Thermoleophilaceae bacterium]